LFDGISDGREIGCRKKLPIGFFACWLDASTAQFLVNLVLLERRCNAAVEK